MLASLASRMRASGQPILLLSVALSGLGCESFIGADFGDFKLADGGGLLDGQSSDATLPPPRADAEAGDDDDGGAPSDAGCTPGEIHEIATCGNCGSYRQLCNGRRVFEPPYCHEPPDRACAPESKEQRSCEGDGTQTATCTATCTWMLDTCRHSTCVATQVEKVQCGKCGTQTRTCQATDGGLQWSPFSECVDEQQCAPGTADRGACGRCGNHARMCDGQCRWGSWDGCQDEGLCAPGDTEERCLLIKQRRECTDQCVWGDWIGLCL